MNLNHLTKILGALLILQDVRALPNQQQSEVLAARDDAQAPWFQIFGADHGPKIKHLEHANPVSTVQENGAGMNNWLPILLGFTKCNELWPLSFFPDRQDDSPDFPPGQAYSIPFDKRDGKRHEKFANLKSMDKTLKVIPGFNVSGMEKEAWWPWALLEGVQAYASDDTVLDIEQSITTLSGIETVVIEGEDLKDTNKLWDDVYSQAKDTPIWIQYGSEDYGVILDRFEQDYNERNPRPGTAGRHIVTKKLYTSADGLRGFFGNPLQYVDVAPTRIVHLKDFARFDGTRVGEWDMPEEPLKPQ